MQLLDYFLLNIKLWRAGKNILHMIQTHSVQINFLQMFTKIAHHLFHDAQKCVLNLNWPNLHTYLRKTKKNFANGLIFLFALNSNKNILKFVWLFCYTRRSELSKVLQIKHKIEFNSPKNANSHRIALVWTKQIFSK